MKNAAKYDPLGEAKKGTVGPHEYVRRVHSELDDIVSKILSRPYVEREGVGTRSGGALEEALKIM